MTETDKQSRRIYPNVQIYRLNLWDRQSIMCQPVPLTRNHQKKEELL